MAGTPRSARPARADTARPATVPAKQKVGDMVARLGAHDVSIEDLRATLAIQFRRIADLQVQVDALRAGCAAGKPQAPKAGDQGRR